MAYSYYDPANRTTAAISYASPAIGALTYSGTARNIIVASDLAKALYGIVDGVPTWKKSYAGWPRGVCIYENLAFVADQEDIQVMNPYTGYVHRVVSVPDAPGSINAISMLIYGGHHWVIICFDVNGTESVRGYHMNHLVLTEQWRCAETAAHPRHAELAAGWVFVCDTFGHRVFGITLANALSVVHYCYFPNHIQMVASDCGLITAEHENRILRWDYHPSPTISIDLGAPVAPYNDATKTKTDIVSLETGTFDPASTFTPKKSLCAEEAQGDDTIYSPNSCRLYTGVGYLVADTDNHAVKIFDSGSVVTKITGFNNPVNAWLF